MNHTGWILTAISLFAIHGTAAGAGSLEVLVEPGRVAVHAEEVPLGRILETLAERGGMDVLIDERRATQPLTVRLETREIEQAIVRLIHEAGGGNYAIVRAYAHGKFETFLFQDPGQGASAAAQPSEPAYGPPPNLPSYPTPPVGGGAAYAGAGPEAPYRGAPPPYVDPRRSTRTLRNFMLPPEAQPMPVPRRGQGRTSVR